MSRRGSLERRERRFAILALSPAVVLMGALIGVPVVRVLMASFERVTTGSSRGEFVGLDNYRWALQQAEFFLAFGRSMTWTFGSVALELTIGLGLALLLHQSFRGRGIARTLLLFPYLIPTVVAVMVWRYMFHDIVGILNVILREVGLTTQPVLWLNSPAIAMFSVIIVGAWKFFPFVVLALLGILQAIPQGQYEAALIDGAGYWQQFRHVTLPQIMPVLLLTGLLRLIWTFQKFDIIYLMTGGGPLNATTTLPLFVYDLAFVDFNMGRAAAVAILMFAFLIVLLVAYAFALRRVER